MMYLTGDQLKKEIKKLKLTQFEAASILGIGRTTLIMWMNKAVLEEDECEQVRTKLGITIKPSDNQYAYEIDAKSISNDYLQRIIAAQEETIASLKETISSQKELINALREDIDRLRS